MKAKPCVIMSFLEGQKIGTTFSVGPNFLPPIVRYQKAHQYFANFSSEPKNQNHFDLVGCSDGMSSIEEDVWGLVTETIFKFNN
jgi:hypothetical protein